ncbi:MAG: PocR ligand-binding domain-containing protein [Bacilli bacterium]
MIKFNLEKLRNLLENIYLLSGIKVSIYDEKQNEILYYPYKYNSYCELIRSTKAGTAICLKADHERLEECRLTRQSKTYICPMGLTEVFAPILIKGELVGYITLGQIISNKTDLKALLKNAINLDLNETKVQKAIQSIDKKTEELINASTLILAACAKYVFFDRYIEIKNDDLANKISEYISDNLKEKITVDLLCQHFFLSRSMLYKIFHNYFSSTVAMYVQMMRVDKAKEYLLDTNLQIKEVAELVGQEYNYFSKIFHKVTGISPKKYQQLHNEKN